VDVVLYTEQEWLDGALVLIRPDGYIGLRCKSSDVSALRRYMALIQGRIEPISV
jgi:hypothetical protein